MEHTAQCWLDLLADKVKARFEDRIWFLGFQGSVRRGEETPESDIDVVLILDTLHAADLVRYRELIQSMPDREKACGFVSGKEELFHWPASELFYFYYDTQPILGDLEELKSRFTRRDISNAFRQEAANLYHAACHSFVFDEPAACLRSLLKSVFFIELGMVFLEKGVFAESKRALCSMVEGVDKELLEISMSCGSWGNLSSGQVTEIYDKLICWSGNILKKY